MVTGFAASYTFFSGQLAFEAEIDLTYMGGI
jgi:hypothetical protein